MTEAEKMRKYAEAHGREELRLPKLTDEQLKKWKAMIEREPSYIHIESGFPIRPLPCVRDEHGEIKGQTVKELFSKINEELDELKTEITYHGVAVIADSAADAKEKLIQPLDIKAIAEEAADTITAITTMLEALGIDAEMRDEAQHRVNAKNRERGRL